MAEDVEVVIERREPRRDRVEAEPFRHHDEQQRHLMTKERNFPALVHRFVLRLRIPSATTARRMMAPWIALSQYASTRKWISAGETQASSSRPTNTPQSV